jgi:hypothetical protein
MEENVITALPLAGDQSVGFGIWTLIVDADPVVKLVLLLLVLASRPAGSGDTGDRV